MDETNTEDPREGMGADDIVFSVPVKTNVEMIRLCSNGNIYIRGKLAENDMDVVNGLRSLIIKAQASGS